MAYRHRNSVILGQPSEPVRRHPPMTRNDRFSPSSAMVLQCAGDEDDDNVSASAVLFPGRPFAAIQACHASSPESARHAPTLTRVLATDLAFMKYRSVVPSTLLHSRIQLGTAGLTDKLWLRVSTACDFLSNWGVQVNLSIWRGLPCDVLIVDRTSSYGLLAYEVAIRRNIRMLAVESTIEHIPCLPREANSATIAGALHEILFESSTRRTLSTSPEQKGSISHMTDPWPHD